LVNVPDLTFKGYLFHQLMHALCPVPDTLALLQTTAYYSRGKYFILEEAF
jgi:hypothetical protein